MTIALTVLHVFVSLFMIGVVLLQSGKGAEMGASFGSSGSQSGSHVLAAMGIAPADAYAVLRFSFGPFTSEAEVTRAGQAAVRAAMQARAIGGS